MDNSGPGLNFLDLEPFRAFSGSPVFVLGQHLPSLPPGLEHTVPGSSQPHDALTSDAWLCMFTLQEPLEKAQLLALVGDQLIQSHHYAADTIRPWCVELRHLCDDFINGNKKKWDILGKSLEFHRQLDKVSKTQPRT